MRSILQRYASVCVLRPHPLSQDGVPVHTMMSNASVTTRCPPRSLRRAYEWRLLTSISGWA